MEPLAGLRPRLPWQPEAAAWLSSRDLAILCADKRLGKCTLAVEWAIRRGAQRILLVAPPSSLADWCTELSSDNQRWVLLLGERQSRLENAARALAEDGRCFFVTNAQGTFLPAGRKVVCSCCEGTGTCDGTSAICPYCEGKGAVKAGKAEPTEIATFDWDAVIWDECTVALCNPGTQTNEIAFQYLSRAKRKLVLSGEPAPEGPHQLFEPWRFVYGSFMGFHKFWPWREEHFQQLGYDWVCRPGHLAMIKNAAREQGYFLTQKQAGLEVVKTYERYSVELPAKLRKAYDSCEKYMEVPFGDATPVELAMTKYKVVSTNWLSQMAGGFPREFPELHSDHKLAAIEDLVLRRFRKDKLVITCRYNAEVAAVKKFLAGKGVRAELIWGTLDVPTRKALQSQFNDGNLRVLVMQVKCAMHGLNLAKNCNTMLRYSLPDRLEEVNQPTDRIVSPVKKNVLAYIDIVSEDTVDEDRINALGDKSINSRYIMNRPQLVFIKKFAENFRKRKEAKRAA